MGKEDNFIIQLLKNVTVKICQTKIIVKKL